MTAAGAQGPEYERDGFRLQIAGGSQAAGRARREIARLDADLDTQLLDSLRLLITELVSNSVRHAGASTVELAVELSPKLVRVEIGNRGEPFTPPARGARQGAASGWGLFLVESLSRDWGVVQDGGCQRVWFEIPRA